MVWPLARLEILALRGIQKKNFRDARTTTLLNIEPRPQQIVSTKRPENILKNLVPSYRLENQIRSQGNYYTKTRSSRVIIAGL